MEIALTGLTQQFGSAASVESARQRQQQGAQQQTSAGNSRAQEAQQQSTRSRAENNQRTPPGAENSRIINGEVLSSETRRVDSRDANSSFFSRSSTNQQPSGQPDNRRISSQQAVQNFQENEDIIPASNELRQVSGIIDTFA